ncbi:transglycosylase family protein [Streptomyces sp. NPDC004732]|uniref:transglycosylase family protein n=1 Tax=Streptomyces sp. NPDC004732 TaxID=3154290 RepID=UPI00339ED82D
MLSGSGRHRRPRQAPAIIVAAGVTGSAIAIPLLGATSASAADTTTWEKLAECESGGAWSANPGSGYYGGLQLSQDNWEAYGGLDYAPSADQASRSQQIAVAEQILDDQGTAAWPSCAPIAGLTQDGAAADVDPGAPVTPKPSEPSGSTDPDGSDGSKGDKDSDKGSGKGSDDDSGKDSDKDSGKGKDKGEETGEPSDSADPSDGPEEPSSGADDSRDKNHDESGEKDHKDDKGEAGGKADGKKDDSGKSGEDDATSPTPEKSTDPADEADGSDDSAGRHRGDRADESEGADGRSGRHASRGENRSGGVADGAYTVRSGDSLSVIADDLGVDGGWHELYSENKKTVGGDPDLILPGQSLDLGEK